jgi:hypothetical protein
LMGFWWFFAFRYTKFQYFGVSSCAKTGAQVASVGPRYAWHTTWDDQRVRSGVWRASDHAPWRFYLGNFHGNVWQFQRVSRHQFLVMEIDGWPTINIWNNETMSFIHIYPSIWGTWYSIDSDGFKNIEHITSNNKRDMIELPVGKESWSKLCVYIYIFIIIILKRMTEWTIMSVHENLGDTATKDLRDIAEKSYACCAFRLKHVLIRVCLKIVYP